MPKDDRPYWVDQVFEKHECFTYGDHAILKIKLPQGEVKLIVPKYLPEVTILKSAESDGLLFLVGHDTEEHRGAPMGVLLVARKSKKKDTYETVVWHELFPWALKYLGLSDATPKDI